MKKPIYNLCALFILLVLASCMNESELIENTTNEAKITEQEAIKKHSFAYLDDEQDYQNERFADVDGVSTIEGTISTRNGVESSAIYYPTKIRSGKLPVVVVCHGFIRNKEKMAWIAKSIATKGFITYAITTSNHINPFAQPRDWSYSYKSAFENIRNENTLRNSPLYGRFDTNKISIVGHSMGGGGVFYFADQTRENIKSIVSLAPYANSTFKPGRRTTVPSLVLAGGLDILSPKRMTEQIYRTVRSKRKKYIFYWYATHIDFERKMYLHPEILKEATNWLEKYGK